MVKADGLGLQMIADGNYVPETLAVSIELNGKDFPQGAALLKEQASGLLNPMMAQIALGYLESLDEASSNYPVPATNQP